MKSRDLHVLAIASSLGLIGLGAGLALSLIQGIQNGNWVYLIIFLVIGGLGGTAIWSAGRSLYMVTHPKQEVLKDEE